MAHTVGPVMDPLRVRDTEPSDRHWLTASPACPTPMVTVVVRGKTRLNGR
jgi:hypothetical protein